VSDDIRAVHHIYRTEEDGNPVIFSESLEDMLNREGIDKRDFDFVFQFVGMAGDPKFNHAPISLNGDYCYGCVLDTITVIQYCRGNLK